MNSEERKAKEKKYSDLLNKYDEFHLIGAAPKLSGATTTLPYGVKLVSSFTPEQQADYKAVFALSEAEYASIKVQPE